MSPGLSKRCLTWAAASLLSCWAGSDAPADQASGDTLTEQERASLTAVCSRCHNLQVVTNATMSYQAWHETVQSMMDRGAQATDDQLEDIMDLLHRTATTINVNTADSDELGVVLQVPDAVVNAIIARRKTRKFDTLADLKTVPGVNGPTVDAKARLLFFK